MADEISWLIERRDRSIGMPEYLYVYGGGADDPERCSGRFSWTNNHYAALRFSRKVDAILFVGALRVLSEVVPHGQTLPGLRAGDPAPAVCEHMWTAPFVA